MSSCSSWNDRSVNINVENFEILEVLVGYAEGILRVTNRGGMGTTKPERGFVSDFGRNLDSEKLNTTFVEVALDEVTNPARIAEPVRDVFMSSLADSDKLNIYKKTTLQTEPSKTNGRRFKLAIAVSRQLDTFHVVHSEVYEEPLKDDEVHIDVIAAALNVKDITKALDQASVL
ncbi:MAG: hypothetical protein Q9165_005404 [Trypethelium subeluteriae]